MYYHGNSLHIYSCARHKHKQEEQNLERNRKATELEQKRQTAELEAKRRENELRAYEQKERIDVELQRTKDEEAHTAAIRDLEVQTRTATAAFDKAKQDNEAHWEKVKMKYDELSMDLDRRGKEYTMELEKKEKEQQLELASRGEAQRLRHEKAKEKQFRKHEGEAHQLELRLKEEKQKFDQVLEEKKADAQIEINREIGTRMKVDVEAIAADGAQLRVRLANDVNPELAKLFLPGIMKMQIQAPPDAQQSTNPEDQAKTDQEASEEPSGERSQERNQPEKETK